MMPKQQHRPPTSEPSDTKDAPQAENRVADDEHLKRKQDRKWREKIEKDVAECREVLERRAMQEANPINPQRVFWELSPRLPDDCILAGDSGSGTNWYARDIQFRRGMMGSLSGGMASMGCGVPYAIAAKFAHPERRVIALVGDGAMQMNGNSELITMAKYWRRWRDPRLIVLVLDNRDLNQVTWEQRACWAATSNTRLRRIFRIFHTRDTLS
jgi:pyruvate dehydrogenase (quinone)